MSALPLHPGVGHRHIFAKEGDPARGFHPPGGQASRHTAANPTTDNRCSDIVPPLVWTDCAHRLRSVSTPEDVPLRSTDEGGGGAWLCGSKPMPQKQPVSTIPLRYQTVALERDESKRTYLHPVAGSEAARIGAGLFTKPVRSRRRRDPTRAPL